ncbi:hypothetical protein JD844_000206 [Phrynosoma platyrhinos]|uniref:Polycystic kidney disease protein 1-like 2 n=1 Tax=Phrynosoma platyrhinos TaxID=52577 RepID=A0ABQ7SQG7_PHRPL|nr:hypothetical protein JD844_000206 [Phrynosoma platyrhinos]
MIWLDTSNITYSNWHQDPPSVLTSSCGYILKNSGYEWGITENCSQEFDFICEFESNHSIACDNFNATVQCGSGEVIQIGDSFFGRKTPHYCVSETRLERPFLIKGPKRNGLIRFLAGQCHGLQACQVAADGTFFGDPCPTLGSYLSVQYHCMEGLRLAVTEESFVFENVTISLKWLLSPYSGNLSCIISTGDGNTIDPYYPPSLLSNVSHRYDSPGEFAIFVECTTSEWHVTAQKLLTVQDKMDELTITGCFSKYEVGNSSHCRTLYQETLWIQVELNGGTGVTYTVLSNNKTVMESHVQSGIVPHNLTLDGASQQQIGPGIHLLEVVASSNTTESEITEILTIHLVEPVSGLQAELTSNSVEFGEDLEIKVSVHQGAPKKLRFEVTGSNETFSHWRDCPEGAAETYRIPLEAEGTFLVKVLAMNAFSNISTDVGMVTVSSNNLLEDEEKSNIKRRVVSIEETLIRQWCEMNCKPVNVTEDVILSVSTETESEATLYKWYLDHSFHRKSNTTTLVLNGSFLQTQGEAFRIKVTAMNEHKYGEETFVVSTMPPPIAPVCTISPRQGSVLTSFSISCYSSCLEDQCPPTDSSALTYCFYLELNSLLHCGQDPVLPSVYFPLGEEDNNFLLQIHVAVSNPYGDTVHTNSTVRLREIMLTTLSTVNVTSMQTALKMSEVLKEVTYRSKELSSLAQVEAGHTLKSVSESLLIVNSEDGQDDVQRKEAASYLFTAVSNVLEAGSQNGTEDASAPESSQSLVSQQVLTAVGNLQSAILIGKLPDDEPTVLTAPSAVMYINRLQTDNIDSTSIRVSDSSSASFTLPSASSLSVLEESDETVDIRASPSFFTVGPKTTPDSTQCLCNHLTFFGSSFFVMPNTIDVSKTVELFATFVDNPVVVTTVGCIFLVYLLVLIWARRKDNQDDAKVKITVLEDNDPFAQYRYLVTVYTGHRRGAATTAKVTLTLYGQEGESEPHHLMDPDRPVFERGGGDVFLLCTLFPLGELQSIRLWHDNSGESPSWYVNRVLVHDVATDQKWYFLCNSWLAIDVGDCVLDKVFPVATEQDMKQFSNLFFMKTSKGFRDGHIWYSIFNRCPRSSFTRVQRVSCCFSLLLCTMLTSIMFWGVPKDPADQKMDLGKIEFTWQEVMIGFESSLLMFPINLLIVQIFRNIRPRSKKEKKPGKSGRVSPDLPATPQQVTQSVSLSPEAVIKDIRRIASSLFKTLKAPLPSPEPDFGKSTDINKLLALVEDIICQQNRIGQEFYDESKKKDDPIIITLGLVDLQEKTKTPAPEKGIRGRLKHRDYNRCLYKQLQHVGLELELLGPHKFQSPQSYSQAVRQVRHMKGFLESQLSSGASISERGSPTPSLPEDGKKELTPKGLPWWFVYIGWLLVAVTSGDLNPIFGLRRDSGSDTYQPPPATDIEKMKNNRIKEQKAFALIREILAYLGFLWMLLLVAYGQRDPNSYYLNKHIENSFTDGFGEVLSYQDFFKWARTTLIKNLYGPYQDGNSKLVGSARIRQVRVKSNTCPIAPKLNLTVGDCRAPYSFDTEDTTNYGVNWNISSLDNSSELGSVWQYQSQSELRGHPIWGKLAVYRGGGYVVHLGTDSQNASRILQYLFENIWLDTFTRAVFVEFTVYNANVNLFCIVSLMFETSALGAFFTRAELQSIRLYPYTDGLHIFVVAAEVIYFLFVIYYMVGQGKLMKALKWNYFRSKWNLLELAIITISWSALSVFVRRTILGSRDITTVDALLGYLIAFLVLLSTVKLWHLLRLNPKLNMITSTLRRAWGDISGFATVIIIMFLAYSIATNLIYGWKLNSYKTLFDSAETMVSLQLGIFNYEEASEEEEIVDLMLKKMSSFLGIRCKNDQKPDCDKPLENTSGN